jgi:hypothetical protein
MGDEPQKTLSEWERLTGREGRGEGVAASAVGSEGDVEGLARSEVSAGCCSDLAPEAVEGLAEGSSMVTSYLCRRGVEGVICRGS